MAAVYVSIDDPIRGASRRIATTSTRRVTAEGTNARTAATAEGSLPGSCGPVGPGRRSSVIAPA
jgi:hypothetical protein